MNKSPFLNPKCTGLEGISTYLSCILLPFNSPLNLGNHPEKGIAAFPALSPDDPSTGMDRASSLDRVLYSVQEAIRFLAGVGFYLDDNSGLSPVKQRGVEHLQITHPWFQVLLLTTPCLTASYSPP